MIKKANGNKRLQLRQVMMKYRLLIFKKPQKIMKRKLKKSKSNRIGIKQRKQTFLKRKNQ